VQETPASKKGTHQYVFFDSNVFLQTAVYRTTCRRLRHQRGARSSMSSLTATRSYRLQFTASRAGESKGGTHQYVFFDSNVSLQTAVYRFTCRRLRHQRGARTSMSSLTAPCSYSLQFTASRTGDSGIKGGHAPVCLL